MRNTPTHIAAMLPAGQPPPTHPKVSAGDFSPIAPEPQYGPPNPSYPSPQGHQSGSGAGAASWSCLKVKVAKLNRHGEVVWNQSRAMGLKLRRNIRAGAPGHLTTSFGELISL